MITDVTTPDQVDQQDQETSQDASQDTTTIESLMETVKGFKGEIDGLNRKISLDATERKTLEDKLKLSELDKLGEKDRAAEELRIMKEEKQIIEDETVLLKRSRLVDKALADAGLPIEFAKRISGDEESTIIEDVTELNDHITKYINEGIDKGITKRLSGDVPDSGNPPDTGSLDSKIKAAQDAGQWAKVMDLKAQKQKLNE